MEDEVRINREQEAAIDELKSALAQEQSNNAEQRREIDTLTAALKGQAAQVQKVSDQLELSKAASRMVLNND